MTKADFRKKARNKLILYTAVAIITFTLYICFEIVFRDMIDRHGTGGPGGGLIGIFCVSISQIAKYAKVLKNEEALKKLIIRENDEREKMIALKASEITLEIISVLLLIALFVSSVLNYTVFYTLLAATAVFVLIFGIVSSAVKKKY